MKYALSLLVVVLLAGCSAYHPLRDGVGFTEFPVGQSAYQITYRGDADMSATEARQYALTRAAELAALRGMPFFEIQNERIYLFAGADYEPGYYGGYYGGYGRFRRGYVRYYSPGYIDYYTVPTAWMQVQLLPAANAQAIPAGYILRQAQRDKVTLSPGVAELVPGLPAYAVAIPPLPAPMTQPGAPPGPPVVAPPPPGPPSGPLPAPIGPPQP